MIDIAYLKQLLEIFDASTVQDLRIEREGTEIRLSKNHRREEPAQIVQMAYPPTQAAQQMQPPVAEQAKTPSAGTAETASAASQTDKKFHEIRSPIVGSFYRSPSPDAPPFVEVGQAVSPGEVLCIIEAMKLMNEIECDAYGKIAKILVENAQPVEYNQLLFLIEQD